MLIELVNFHLTMSKTPTQLNDDLTCCDTVTHTGDWFMLEGDEDEVSHRVLWGEAAGVGVSGGPL